MAMQQTLTAGFRIHEHDLESLFVLKTGIPWEYLPLLKRSPPSEKPVAP
ncbi:MAG: transposase [Candidatus Dormibacteraeota bacterium]|nr:transposase [Candidatus Dormibacteraeota bacterium]